MACQTGDGKTVDFVTAPGNKICLSLSELETLRGSDKSLNIDIGPVELDNNSKCIGLYEYVLVSKPTVAADHGNYCVVLKFEDRIELATTEAKADSISDLFFKTGGKRFPASDRKIIRDRFKIGCHMTGGM
jgi:hypothetical protein